MHGFVELNQVSGTLIYVKVDQIVTVTPRDEYRPNGESVLVLAAGDQSITLTVREGTYKVMELIQAESEDS